MKKYGGQIIFNGISILLGSFLLRTAGSSAGKGLQIVLILVLIAVLCAGNIIFVKKADSGKGVFEKDYIIKALDINKNDKEKTSELLQVGLSTLYRKLKELEINT